MTWTPTTGDYGADNIGDMIAIIEEHNCSHGCVHGAHNARAAKKFGGSGGHCPILARLINEEPMPELQQLPTYPVCLKFEPAPDPILRGMRPPKDVDPLFDIDTTQEKVKFVPRETL